MHIIIGAITAIAGLIWAMHSLQNAGVDLNAFNPFTWARRRRWSRQLNVKPMHSLTDSMEAAALLVVSIARAEGEVTRDTKMEILDLFTKEFGLKRNKSIEIYSSSSYMLQDILNMDSEVKHVLAPSKSTFQEKHIEKLLNMLTKVSTLEGKATEQQNLIIKAVKAEFNAGPEKPKKW